jgi:hypothetical protein
MAATSWMVSDLVGSLEPDPWRAANPFSDDITQCHQVLFDPTGTRGDKIVALNQWLATSQPCRFGRIEAKQNRLAFCVLTENDLERSDQDIRAKIARERLQWKRKALSGDSHGFLIVAISERIAVARPGPQLLRLASRLCGLYLDDERHDEILHDEVLLEMNVDGKIEWRKWKVGANYFSAQGDGRWWRDHRFPGGMAFSMNSVGHMARWQAERVLSKSQAATESVAGVPRDRLVFFALPLAMRSIGPREERPCKGTWLAPYGDFSEDKEPPLLAQRPLYFKDLAGYGENRYRGLYHTDHTIPSDYFDEGLWRNEDLKEREDLYFTYLHSLDDDHYLSMGLGEHFDPDKDDSTK